MTHGVLLSVLLDLVGCAIEGTASLSSFFDKGEWGPPTVCPISPTRVLCPSSPSLKQRALSSCNLFPLGSIEDLCIFMLQNILVTPKETRHTGGRISGSKKETRGANWRTEPLPGSDLTCCFQNQPYDKQLLYLLPHMAVPTLRIRSGFEGFHFITLTLAHSPDKVILIERI